MEIKTTENLQSTLQVILTNLPSEYTHNVGYSLKHPSAIYNTSYSKVIDSLEDFFIDYDNFIINGFDKNNQKEVSQHLKSYKNVLYILREHLDDILSILKILTKQPPNEKKNRNQYVWLIMNGDDSIQRFLKEISTYKKYLDDIVNELKHNNGVLGSNNFYSSADPKKYCIGYFVANVVDDTYSPVEKIHKPFNGMLTGFSFRRDLHYNLFHVFFMSELLRIHIEETLGIIVPKNKESKPSDKTKKIFIKLMEMSRYQFPDEYVKPIPSVSYSKNGLKLSFPSQLSLHKDDLDCVLLTHSFDGHTRAFKLLYTKN